MTRLAFFSGLILVLFSVSLGFSDDPGNTPNDEIIPISNYQVDYAHTNIGFSVRHMVLSKVTGEFKDFEVVLKWDDKNLNNSYFEARIKAISIDTDNERRDNHLKSYDFFDVENHPDIIFKSNKIEKKRFEYVAHGDLTIRGITKSISLPFRVLGQFVQKDGKTRIGIEAEIIINRFDYNVSWDKTFDTGGLIVGEEVHIDIQAEFVSL